MIRHTLRRSGGRLLFGLVLLFVGGYYFLRNTLGFDLGELDGDAIWPVIVIVLGGWILYENLGRQAEPPAS